MNFLQPAWLWGLTALAIPIIVHLFNFRRTRRIYFSNTRFIRKVQEATKSKRKLKHYLILFTRLMFVLWLVLAFAQPFIPATEGNLNEERVYFYLDNSFSMSRQSGEQITALEEGMAYIEELVNLYPSGTDFYLLTNDFAPFSHAPHSASQILELLTEVNLTGKVRSAEEIISRWESQRKVEGEGAYYFISDMQQSTFGIDQLTQVDSTVQINLLAVQSQKVGNVFVDTVFLDNPFLIGKETVKLNVRIRNNADDPADDIQVSVFLSDIQTGSTTIDIGPSETATLQFDLIIDPQETFEGRVSIEEYPVTFDNDSYFVLDLGDRIDILDIKGAKGSNAIATVYGNQELFNYRSYGYSNLDYNAINSSDLVIVNQIENVDAALATAIQSYMQAGGEVILVPSSEYNLDTYKRIFGGLLASDSSGMTRLSTPDFNNPFFSQVFEEKDPAISMPSSRPLLTWYGGSDLLSYSTGDPFLSVINEQLYLFSSPFTEGFSEFYKHALFVPVMYKIAALSSSGKQPLYHYLNESTLAFTLDSLRNNQIFKLVKNEEEVIPSQRMVNQNLYLQLPAYQLSAGFYQLVEEGKVYETVAFNISKVESLLETLSSQEIKNLLEIYPAMTIYDVQDADQFRSTLEDEYVGWSLWRYCLALAIYF